MTLIKRNFGSALDQLLSEEFTGHSLIDKLFKSSSFTLDDSKISADENGYEFQVPLPGFTKEEVRLSLENNLLSIHAKTDRDKSYQKEITKSYSILKEVAVDKIEAKMENGILYIKIPYIGPKEGNRTIEIQ